MIVVGDSTVTNEASAVSLARYAQVIGYPGCAFNGVRRDGDITGQCRVVWSKFERDQVAKYLAEAQEEIEHEVGYFLSPRFVVGKLSDQPDGNDRYVDDQAFRCPMITRWPKVIQAGVRATTIISLGAAVDHTTDPAVIGPFATMATVAREITVYHAGTDIEITPSAVTIAGGFVTVQVPRCRMVRPAIADTPDVGLDYLTVANFSDQVDVVQVYVDQTVGAELVVDHRCSALCAAAGCSEATRTGCERVVDARHGILDVQPATWSAGAWSGWPGCGVPVRARLNYLAGAQELSRQAEDTIIRLAHAKMPLQPCGCDLGNQLWMRDRNIPQVLTRERINCPFGLSDGAWVAWKFAESMKQLRGSTL